MRVKEKCVPNVLCIPKRLSVSSRCGTVDLCKNQKRIHWWKIQLHQGNMKVEEEVEKCYDSILNQQIVLEEISKLPVGNPNKLGF